MPDDSNLSRLTTLKLGQSFGGKPVEATFGRVTFDLSIPGLPIVLKEPVPERREFFATQPFNFTLESFNLRHASRKCTTSRRIPHGCRSGARISIEVMPCRSSETEIAVKVVGESFYENNLRELCGPAEDHMRQLAKTAILTLENDNPYDGNAVRVDVDGVTVGHLSRSDARRFRAAYGGRGMSQVSCAALLISLRGDATSDYGVRLDLHI